MTISEVRIRLKDSEESKVKATASVTFDNCFVVHDIKVVEGNTETFIAMPSRRSSQGGYIDIVHPLNIATRETIKNAILTKYKEVISQTSR